MDSNQTVIPPHSAQNELVTTEEWKLSQIRSKF